MDFSWADFATFLVPLLRGAKYSVLLTVIIMIISTVCGLLVALGRLSGRRWLTVLLRGYVEFIRSTPALVHLYYIYFVFPSFNITLGAMTAGIIGLSIGYTAYLSEVFRAAIISIPRAQTEASSSLGMSYVQTMTKVILPQAGRLALPPTVNYLLSLMKDTSLLSLVTIQELMFSGLLLGSTTFKYFTILTEVALIYFVLGYPLTILSSWLERRMNATHADTGSSGLAWRSRPLQPAQADVASRSPR
jgi:polar amino acid transport system permease protein